MKIYLKVLFFLSLCSVVSCLCILFVNSLNLTLCQGNCELVEIETCIVSALLIMELYTLKWAVFVNILLVGFILYQEWILWFCDFVNLWYSLLKLGHMMLAALLLSTSW